MTKGIIKAQVVRQIEIADKIYRITLRHDILTPDAAPGQFINLYLRDKSMLLPRPISICRWEAGRIDLVYRVVGNGTRELSTYRAGDSLRISTPLGHGYDLDAVFEALDRTPSASKTIALVAGGLGIPPMEELAKTIRRHIESGCGEQKTRLTALLGFQSEPFLTEELGSFCDEVHLASERGAAGFYGNVLEMMEQQEIHADYYLSCGPKPMLKALVRLCGRSDRPLQVSLEERMGCGYGACVGCTCKTKETVDGTVRIKQKKVCKDGPVFFGDEVVWDE